MGIDNESRLIFGITFSYEEMQEIFRDQQFDWYNVFVNEEYGDEINMDKYPSLYLGYASDYYDSDCLYWSFYISINEPENTELSIEEMKNLSDNWEDSDYRKFLKDFNISFVEPKLISLPHIY